MFDMNTPGNELIQKRPRRGDETLALGQGDHGEHAAHGNAQPGGRSTSPAISSGAVWQGDTRNRARASTNS